MDPPLPWEYPSLRTGELRHNATGFHAASQHMPMIAITSDDRITLIKRMLHADNDRFLADIKMAETADQAHAVKLPCALFKAADQQHVLIELH